MSRRRQNPAQRLALQAFELSLAAPQVVAHRVARMAQAGHAPNARDRAEFTRMGQEKVQAFYQSWGAMWTQTWASQLQMAQAASSMAVAAASGSQRGMASAAAAGAAIATRVATAGLAPVHAKAVSNSKRLGRLKKR